MSSNRWCLNMRLPLTLVIAALCPLSAATETRQAAETQAQGPPISSTATTDDYNRRLQQLMQTLSGSVQNPTAWDYRIGSEDLLEISVFEAADLNRTVRVSAGGEISLPLLGAVGARGLTPRELEVVLQELLRRTYMKDPHVAVFVREMQSHSVSVFGAVKKPGVFQIRGAKPLVEVLSMAEGLAEDAGDEVIVMRQAGLVEVTNSAGPKPMAAIDREGKGSEAPLPPEGSSGNKTLDIDLKNLLDSSNPRYNVPVYPGDVVKVTRAGVVYVVGEVRKPGGFILKTNENISVLQALALAEGLTRTSAKSRARIVRTDAATGSRNEVTIDLGKILGGKAADPLLHPKDIVFVPNSTGRSALYRSAEAAIGIGSGLAIYRR